LALRRRAGARNGNTDGTCLESIQRGERRNAILYGALAGFLRYAIAALLAAGAACSSTGTGGGLGGTSSQSQCGGELGCRPWDCFCKDGQTTGGSTCSLGVCASGAELCATRCESHGGVDSFEPQRAVEDSPECTAFCNRVHTECGADVRCDIWFWCRVDADHCEASARDYFSCMTENTTFQCTEHGWSASGCPYRDELCGTDGGLAGDGGANEDAAAAGGTDAGPDGA
jgi:hypothetical protein